MDASVVVLVLGLLFAWSLLARWSAMHSITGPIVFLAVGFLAGNEAFGFLDIDADEEVVKLLTEITLTLVLFADASRVNLGVLARAGGLPARLLGIALPLTVGLGWLVAVGLFPSATSLWVPFLIAAALAPTDAALGATIVNDRRIPIGVRRTLNVESGLNDGLITPVVFLALAGAAELEGQPVTVGNALIDIAGGAALGLGLGLVGARLLAVAHQKRWTDPEAANLATLALALLAYALAEALGINGFIAAFVGGMAYGTVADEWTLERIETTENFGLLTSLITWFLFGALLLPQLVDDLRWAHLGYAVLSLTVLRMLPVTISLAGSGVSWRTMLILGWFGPRGLATMLFGLLTAETLTGSDLGEVLPVLGLTVLLSVLLHGATAAPFASWYAGHPDPAVVGDGLEVPMRPTTIRRSPVQPARLQP